MYKISVHPGKYLGNYGQSNFEHYIQDNGSKTETNSSERRQRLINYVDNTWNRDPF